MAGSYYAGAAGIASALAPGTVGNALASGGGGSAGGAGGAINAAAAANPYGQAANVAGDAIKAALGDSSTTSQTSAQRTGNITFGAFSYAAKGATSTAGLTSTTIVWIIGGAVAVVGLVAAFALRRR